MKKLLSLLMVVLFAATFLVACEDGGQIEGGGEEVTPPIGTGEDLVPDVVPEPDQVDISKQIEDMQGSVDEMKKKLQKQIDKLKADLEEGRITAEAERLKAMERVNLMEQQQAELDRVKEEIDGAEDELAEREKKLEDKEEDAVKAAEQVAAEQAAMLINKMELFIKTISADGILTPSVKFCKEDDCKEVGLKITESASSLDNLTKGFLFSGEVSELTTDYADVFQICNAGTGKWKIGQVLLTVNGTPRYLNPAVNTSIRSGEGKNQCITFDRINDWGIAYKAKNRDECHDNNNASDDDILAMVKVDTSQLTSDQINMVTNREQDDKNAKVRWIDEYVGPLCDSNTSSDGYSLICAGTFTGGDHIDPSQFRIRNNEGKDNAEYSWTKAWLFSVKELVDENRCYFGQLGGWDSEAKEDQMISTEHIPCSQDFYDLSGSQGMDEKEWADPAWFTNPGSITVDATTIDTPFHDSSLTQIELLDVDNVDVIKDGIAAVDEAKKYADEINGADYDGEKTIMEDLDAAIDLKNEVYNQTAQECILEEIDEFNRVTRHNINVAYLSAKLASIYAEIDLTDMKEPFIGLQAPVEPAEGEEPEETEDADALNSAIEAATVILEGDLDAEVDKAKAERDKAILALETPLASGCNPAAVEGVEGVEDESTPAEEVPADVEVTPEEVAIPEEAEAMKVKLK
jgi:hypothetical protein